MATEARRLDTTAGDASRTCWIDVAKAMCIILVVMMHSTLGLHGAIGREGFLDPVVAFFAPFRIPAFFVLSGLFVARAMERGFTGFVGKRFLHFGYFYVLWAFIQHVVRAGPQALADPAALAGHMLWALIEPYGTLWFLHLLVVFTLVSYAARRVPPAIVLGAAAAIEILPIATGSTLVDEFAGRYVFFAMGWLMAPAVFRAAAFARREPAFAAAAIAAFALVNGFAVFGARISDAPVIGLALGVAGAMALILAAALVATSDAAGRALAYIGARTLPIYVAFFLPMAGLRIALVHSGFPLDDAPSIGLASLAITAFAVASPLVMERLVRGTVLAFLFERPGVRRSEPDRMVQAPSAAPSTAFEPRLRKAAEGARSRPSESLPQA